MNINDNNENIQELFEGKSFFQKLKVFLPQKEEIIKILFSVNRIICRLLAAWCIYIATTLYHEKNFIKLEFNQTGSFSELVICVTALFIIFSAVALFGHKINTDSFFMFIGATFSVISICIFPPSGNNIIMFWLAVGVVYAMFLVWFVNENESVISKIKIGKKTLIITSILSALAACFILCVVTCLRYKTFSSPNFDFGIFVNMFHNMKETGLPNTTCERDMLLSHFAVHISPIYYLLLPFYIIFPSPYTLQIGQAVILMLGIIPIILLSKHFKLSNKITLVFSGLYVFYTALSTGCFYDFHENCFLAPLLLFTFLFFEKEKPIPMYVCVVLTLCVKEDAAVYLIIFSLYAILSKKKYLHGAIIGILSLTYFIISGIVLKKYGLGMMINRYDNLIHNKDDGLVGALKTIILNPGYIFTQLFSSSDAGFNKFVAFLQIMLPIGFMPFFTKKASRMILLIPLLINLLTMYPYQYEITFQYYFGITAFLFYASIQNYSEASFVIKKSITAVAVAFSISLYSVAVLTQYDYFVKGSKQHDAEHKRMEEILDMIPDDASVCCSTFLLPHIADRSEIYEVEYHGGKCDIDYVVLDMRNSLYLTDMQPYIENGYTEFFCEENMILILISPHLESNI